MMPLKELILHALRLCVGTLSLLLTFFTSIQVMYFLSHPTYNRSTITSKDVWLSASWSLFVNMSLLSLLILEHSVLSLTTLKMGFKKYGLQDFHRSIYVIISTTTWQILLRFWHDIPEVVLWKFNLNLSPYWWLYISIHGLLWIVLYVGNICMDINELTGVKQIYYSIVNLPDPNGRKSQQLQRLNSHMRHPSFLAFTIIFWSVPVMSLDRLLLATIQTLYMYLAWNPDKIDYKYQHSQYIKKFHQLVSLDE